MHPRNNNKIFMVKPVTEQVNSTYPGQVTENPPIHEDKNSNALIKKMVNDAVPNKEPHELNPLKYIEKINKIIVKALHSLEKRYHDSSEDFFLITINEIYKTDDHEDHFECYQTACKYQLKQPLRTACGFFW